MTHREKPTIPDRERRPGVVKLGDRIGAVGGCSPFFKDAGDVASCSNLFDQPREGAADPSGAGGATVRERAAAPCNHNVTIR